ncbi:MAG: CAP domain-containing protein [Acidobacteriota bacterium]
MRRILPVFALLLAISSAAAFAVEITPESVLAGMNAERKARDLPPLQFDPRLSAAADDRMHDMENLGYWSHESPDGRAPFVWLASNGYRFSYAGENLAAGFETEELLMQSWMESKGHRANIVSPLYADCGIAVIEGSTTRRASGKSIVVMFGRLQAADHQRSEK